MEQQTEKRESIDRLLLTPEEVAKAIGCSRSFIFDALRRGDLPSLKLGRLRRVRVADLEIWLARFAEES